MHVKQLDSIIECFLTEGKLIEISIILHLTSIMSRGLTGIKHQDMNLITHHTLIFFTHFPHKMYLS